MDIRRHTAARAAALTLLATIALPAQAITDERARERLDELISTGWAMEEIRQSRDLQDVQACGDAMRAAQADAKELRADIDATPGLHVNLATAASMANRCVSCLPGATSSCDEMEEQLSQIGE